MYVDDTDLLIAARNYKDPINKVINRTQRAIKIWRQGVIQTGGALRPEKCKWYLICFKWKSGKWYYEKKSDRGVIMYLKDTNGTLLFD